MWRRAALIAKKRNIKQGAMQELLSGQRRLPGFKREWQPTKLTNLGTTYGGLSGKTKSDFGQGNAYYIPFMNVMENISIDPTRLDRVRVDRDEESRLRKSGQFSRIYK